jgi:hypothetical protein
MKINGQSLVSVTATVQSVATEFNVGFTLINDGAGLIAYRHDSDYGTLVGATEAALRALGGAILHPGEKVFVEYAPYIEVACITGATATLRVEPGDMVGNPSDAEIAAGSGAADLVFSRVVITEAAAGIADPDLSNPKKLVNISFMESSGARVEMVPFASAPNSIHHSIKATCS